MLNKVIEKSYFSAGMFDHSLTFLVQGHIFTHKNFMSLNVLSRYILFAYLIMKKLSISLLTYFEDFTGVESSVVSCRGGENEPMLTLKLTFC
jgi:hypothetical protein